MCVKTFDVIVIGGGHAGIEAALAAARIGVKTLLLTKQIENIGQMSCNPSIGGIGKSQLVKEIDALGGAMALATDKAGIQFRILNKNNGPAVRATRAQTDRRLYKNAILELFKTQPKLFISKQTINDIRIFNDCVYGVRTNSGIRFQAKTVVMCTGTFLGGVIHIGMKQYSGGRAGDNSSNRLAQSLRNRKFKIKRLKTGTPPRIDSKSVNLDCMQVQTGDKPTPVMSLLGEISLHPAQVNCYITYTNSYTNELISKNIQNSPIFNGKISSIGPRYCPSIEDKITRFPEKNSHQIFIEPEGLTTHELYPNGISTSLTLNIQIELINSILGLSQAQITSPGYAIEYDCFDPRELHYSLETRFLRNLYCAGQINGTTGYEEAAAQGLIAGLNAARIAQGLSDWYPKRNEAYIGVMIDDFITMGTSEPYRMFTSRAEYRLLLREDNADLRLTCIGRKLGLVNKTRFAVYESKTNAISRRPNLNLDARRPAADVYAEVALQVKIQAKYEGYIARQKKERECLIRYKKVPLPKNLDYYKIYGLSTELQQKLTNIRPPTLAEAGCLPGMTPTAIYLLLIHMKNSAQ